MKNFVSRCVAAMAGNGAILLTIGGYVANSQASASLLMAQAPMLGGLFLVALFALAAGYSALGREEDAPAIAVQRLKWSARLFFISLAGFGLALITVGLG